MTRRAKRFLMCVGAFVLVFVLVLAIRNAYAADDETCKAYSVNVEKLTLTLTNDIDVAQAARDRSFVYCGVIDVPTTVRIEEQGTAPATDNGCSKAYKTFRASDGTVIRRGNKGKRVPCPLLSK